MSEVRCSKSHSTVVAPMKRIGSSSSAGATVDVFVCPDGNGHCSQVAARIPVPGDTYVYRFELRDFSLRYVDLAKDEDKASLVEAAAVAARRRAEVTLKEVRSSKLIRAERFSVDRLERELRSAIRSQIEDMSERRRSKVVDGLVNTLAGVAVGQVLGNSMQFPSLDQVAVLAELAEYGEDCRALAERLLAAGIGEAKRLAPQAVESSFQEVGLENLGSGSIQESRTKTKAASVR